ncbi:MULTISPECIES: carbohydrate ABC transporter permease [Kribbella]|jgi:putative aldouronate transport system permease protein|uniref:Carbohydrate ABC transporter membrane protein 2 (CUT1 family) n=1 Tax=Kribbella pratensis TaxID=2512112 RepID=A0ABY2FQ40_9ACTN|nr:MULTISPECIES: carbohydrate ABC transporter permease [Kribbella]TDW94690.1 carbohydrate ABC transporter membrane protein 2 (CUT1 family) [Kribbella pratensis]TDX03285.1 carbohydrate ABC transporter membrane protein 2 (CUT1 family) [Kribbella sp. VKM Ac-2566]
MSITLQGFRRTSVKRSERTTIEETRTDKIFLLGVRIMLWIALILVAVPLIYIVANSFSSPSAVSAGRVLLWPIEPSLRAYKEAFSDPLIMKGYLNSFIYAIGGTLISVTLTIAIAYPLSRRTFFGRNVIMSVLIFTMLFSGGLIPTYLVVQDLGMLNTRWAMVIPSAIGVWQVIIARTFFRSTIPDELYEAATIDGASDLRFLWSIVLPLSKPVIAVIALMYAIFQWNSYFDALIYLKDPGLYPLQIVLRNVLILNTLTGSTTTTSLAQQLEQQQLANVLKYALIVISSLPVLIIYPFVARHFTKGVMVGAVKG